MMNRMCKGKDDPWGYGFDRLVELFRTAAWFWLVGECILPTVLFIYVELLYVVVP